MVNKYPFNYLGKYKTRKKTGLSESNQIMQESDHLSNFSSS